MENGIKSVGTTRYSFWEATAYIFRMAPLTTTRKHPGFLMIALLLPMAAMGVRVSLHFMSLCHECQMHISAINNCIVTGGLELSAQEAGALAETELSIDYYGSIGSDGTCKSGQMSDHGPDQCEIDRYHVCAQDMMGGSSTGAALRWWPFVHCMFMNIDFLKCGNNLKCDTYDEFTKVRDSIVNSCAAVTNINKTELTECANGPRGHALQAASFNRTNALPSADGFAPPFVAGEWAKEADYEWRGLTPDQLKYGKAILTRMCNAMGSKSSNVRACVNITATE